MNQQQNCPTPFLFGGPSENEPSFNMRCPPRSNPVTDLWETPLPPPTQFVFACHSIDDPFVCKPNDTEDQVNKTFFHRRLLQCRSRRTAVRPSASRPTTPVTPPSSGPEPMFGVRTGSSVNSRSSATMAGSSPLTGSEDQTWPAFSFKTGSDFDRYHLRPKVDFSAETSDETRMMKKRSLETVYERDEDREYPGKRVKRLPSEGILSKMHKYSRTPVKRPYAIKSSVMKPRRVLKTPEPRKYEVSLAETMSELGLEEPESKADESMDVDESSDDGEDFSMACNGATFKIGGTYSGRYTTISHAIPSSEDYRASLGLNGILLRGHSGILGSGSDLMNIDD